jgi:hypothetical protein
VQTGCPCLIALIVETSAGATNGGIPDGLVVGLVPFNHQSLITITDQVLRSRFLAKEDHQSLVPIVESQVGSWVPRSRCACRWCIGIYDPP